LNHFTGISYLSRAQESASKFLSENPILADSVTVSSSPATVADTVFVGRIRSRVKNWRQSCIDSGSKTGDGVIASVRHFHMNLILHLLFRFFYMIHLFI
jgi:poly(A)-specific ribonuclease